MPNAHGWLWCDRLQLWLGTWTGPFLRYQATWLRFYDAQEQVVPIYAEAAQQQVEAERQQAEAERQQAATERQRAEAAEAELAKLRARLAQVEGPSQR